MAGARSAWMMKCYPKPLLTAGPRAFGPEKGLESCSEHLGTDAARAMPPGAVARLLGTGDPAASLQRKRSWLAFSVGLVSCGAENPACSNWAVSDEGSIGRPSRHAGT